MSDQTSDRLLYTYLGEPKYLQECDDDECSDCGGHLWEEDEMKRGTCDLCAPKCGFCDTSLQGDETATLHDEIMCGECANILCVSCFEFGDCTCVKLVQQC